MENEVLSGRKTLLQRWEIPLEHLDFTYLKECGDTKKVERIVRILRSGEEGYFPDLQNFAENRLRELNPQSKVLRREDAILRKGQVDTAEWQDIQQGLQQFRDEVKSMKKDSTEFKRNLPPVRALNQTMLESLEESRPMTTKKERIKSAEYSKWDRYDADAEALKIDLDEERKIEDAKLRNKRIKEKPVIEEIFEDDVNLLTPPEKQALAKRHKDKGNDHYRAKEYEEAVDEYTKSLNIFPMAATYNNRGMAYIKQLRFQKGMTDCDACLKLEPRNIKALLRKAQCYQGLDKRNEAYDMYCEVLKIEPENSIAHGHVTDLRRQLPNLPPPNSTKIKIVEDLPDLVPEKVVVGPIKPAQKEKTNTEKTATKVKPKKETVKKLTSNQNETLQKFKEKIKEQKKAKEAYKEHFRQMMCDDVFLLPHHDTRKKEFIIEESKN